MRHRIGHAVGFAVLVAVAITVLGLLVMLLWNWLLPPLFGWSTLGFWQALGLLVLARILFGGFHGRRNGLHGHWRGRMRERWERMTPEQREQFRAGLGGHCRARDRDSEASKTA
jgi:hypothetical protein